MTHNIPDQITPFIGRYDDVNNIVKLLTTHPIVTLVGMGGIGKTRLSIAVGQHLVEHTEDHLDIYFVSLAPITQSSQIVGAIADAIGLTLTSGVADEAQIANHFRNRDIVLIIDNFEHVMDGAYLIPTLIQACPTLTILVTSREKLNVDGEGFYPVGGLTIPDKLTLEDIEQYDVIRLFTQIAKKVDWSFRITTENIADIVTICRCVGGVPLAIELSAAWIRMMSTSDIVSHLTSSVDVLGDSLHHVPDRHQSIRAVFESSWLLLSEQEKQIFAQVSVFRGGFTQDAMQVIFNATPRHILSLIDKSLLSRDNTHRLTIHELLRQYAEEKLRDYPDLHNTIQSRHAAYYATFLQERTFFYSLTSQNRAGTLQEINIELDNIREVWYFAINTFNFEIIKQTLETIYYVYRIRGDYAVGFRLLLEAYSLFDDPRVRKNHLPLYVQFKAMIAIYAQMVNNQDLALRQATEAYELALQLNLTNEIARSLLALCIYHVFNGVLEDARIYGEQALILYQNIDNIEEQTSIYINLAYTYQLMGKYIKAENLFTELVTINEAKNNIHEMAQGNIWLALLNNNQQKYLKAKAYGLKALSQFRTLGVASYAVAIQKNLGISYWGLGNYDEARKYYREGLEIYFDNPHKHLDAALSVMAWVIYLMHSEGNTALGVEVAEHVITHPSTNHENREVADRIYATLRAELPDIIFETARDRGTTISTEGMIDRVYAYLLPITHSIEQTTTIKENIHDLNELVKHALKTGKIPDTVDDDASIELTTTIVQYVKEILEIEKSQMMSKFMENASHDLRTPITIINSNLYLIDHIEDPTRKQHKLDLVKSQVQHLHDIIEGLLLMSRLDGGVDFDFHPINIVPLVRATCIQMTPQAESREIGLSVFVPEKQIQVNADVSYLQEAFINILDNAFNHTPSQASITVTCDENETGCVIQFVDHGEGVAEEHIPYLFERFYRVDTSRSSKGKSGLGLAITKHIIEAHDGTCDLTSRLNEGTTVTIHLPVHR